jgi:hypothetical protein
MSSNTGKVQTDEQYPEEEDFHQLKAPNLLSHFQAQLNPSPLLDSKTLKTRKFRNKLNNPAPNLKVHDVRNQYMSLLSPYVQISMNDVRRERGVYNSNPLSNLDSVITMFSSRSFALMLNILKK